MTWYKFLASGAVGPFSGHPWPPPGGLHQPGEWTTAENGLEPCRSGLHLCRSADLPFWVHEELYVVDVEGPVIEYESFVLARRARLVHRVGWGRGAAGAFSRACVWRVRDLAAEALARTGRREEAHRLLDCTSLDALDRTVGRLVERDSVSASAVAGYVEDALGISGGVQGSGWASAAATTAFVAAAAARATAADDAGTAAWAAERRRQAAWIAELAGH